ncbi:hypothetical protein HED60_00945 [Planctomycetales bacterium ZRK34]|nr:hypothetical protein HED60_00945 [Planctomycetales bacterium ZRK34]
MMHRLTINLIAAGFMLLQAGGVRAAFVQVDDFEPPTYAADDLLNGVNGWTVTPGDQRIVTDPADATNLTLRVINANKDTYKAVPGIAPGDTGTLFFRFYVPDDASGDNDIGIGLTGEDAPNNGSLLRTYFRLNGESGRIDVHDNGSFEQVASLTAGAWYNVWLVVNNEGTGDDVDNINNGAWSAYIQGGAFATQTQLTHSGSDGVFDFRDNGDEITLDRFYMRSNSNNGEGDYALVDDIYIDSTASNLANPLAVPAPMALPAGLALLATMTTRRRL